MFKRHRFVGSALLALVLLGTLAAGYWLWSDQPAPQSIAKSTSESTPQSIAQSPLVPSNSQSGLEDYVALSNGNIEKRAAALQLIRRSWSQGQAVMLLEMAILGRRDQADATMYRLLTNATGQQFGNDADQWYHWIWSQPAAPHPQYAQFKAWLYGHVDPRFAEYFSDEKEATIRLDEIRWGGVLRDGIPPLKNPETISVDAATYLDASDVVFGVEFGGQARAYPKRILAWHEMVKDVVGGQSINGVYCTLCGSMIVYETEVAGKHYELGTSGFLYRSNKLMYDHETKSLWSTLAGEPVVGPLVGKGIKLEPRYVVTTTWGKWKQLHPTTDVLSLRTGHRRDYGEGVAYHDYFATDALMFKVPQLDTRLKNKDEVLVVRRGAGQPLAIAAAFLNANRIYHDTIEATHAATGLEFVVLTDESGANRVFETMGHRFVEWLDHETLTSSDGKQWSVAEDGLVSSGGEMGSATRLARLPAHRAFWFGWHSAYPETRLIK